MSDYGQAKWFQLYARAMLELEHALMAGRIMDARGEICDALKPTKTCPVCTKLSGCQLKMR
jgi:hypothetical protein